jgi:hypothetical protein
MSKNVHFLFYNQYILFVMNKEWLEQITGNIEGGCKSRICGKRDYGRQRAYGCYLLAGNGKLNNDGQAI